jgi:hypothetical protein
MRTAFTKLTLIAFAFAIIGLSAQSSFAGPAQITIVNINAPGVGFNDPTPVAPVGGNPGTTLGQQRLLAFQHAAEIWAARLDSNVPIRIRAQFVALAPGVLGSAGPISVVRNFPGAPLPNTWYHVALANKFAGVDLVPALEDITANFSTNFNFYLGLDNNHGTRPDLVTVLLHEFAHGLGFSQLSNLTTGALFGNPPGPDAYNTRLFETTVGLSWPQMTNAQRALAAHRFGRVVWTGSFVTAGVPSVLEFGIVEARITAPGTISGPVQFGTAAFGPSVATVNVSAPVILALDAIEVGGNQIDGCSPFTNAAEIAGKIALIERGGLCGFAVKARNATEAGAVAAVIYNQPVNGNAAPPGMGDDGINGAFVTIPTISLRRLDGVDLFSTPGAAMSMGNNPNIRAGADELDRARMFAPFPIAGGSSISHFDSAARRNLLMEPAINANLTHKLKAPDDLTFELLRDLGWTFPDADADGVPDDEDCNPNSDTSATIVIGGINTGVANTLFPNGCTMSDLLTQLKAGAATQGDYVAAVAHLTNQWVAEGLISGTQKGTIESAAARNL